MEIMFREAINAKSSDISKILILVYAMVKFEHGLVKNTSFRAFSNHATKGKLNGIISLVRFFFSRVCIVVTILAP